MAIMGRPTLYCKKITDEICQRVASGESIRSICKDTHMPNKDTVFQWKVDYPDFSDQYHHSFTLRMTSEFDDLIHLVDECDIEDIVKVREQVKIRQWVLAKNEPNKYGDKPEPVVTAAPLKFDFTGWSLDEILAFNTGLERATKNNKNE